MTDRDPTNDFLALVDEVRLLDHRLVQVAEALHEDDPITIPQRAVLEYLGRQGATTVPDIARARHVSRQHIQSTVNELLAAGLVETRANPAHARSHHIALTDAGARSIRDMQGVEADFVATLDFAVDTPAIRAATQVLASVRRALADHPHDNEQENTT